VDPVSTTSPEPEEHPVSTEREVRVVDLKVGDLIKSYVDFIPPMQVTRAPLPRQHGMVDWEDTNGTHYCAADDVYTVLDEGQGDE